MAVDTLNLSKPVLQAIETWTSVANHDLGYRTQDATTGRSYRYCQHLGAVAGIVGGPCGLWGASSSTDGTMTNNEVTADASVAQATGVIGVYRGSATSAASIYGFIEEVQTSVATTVMSSYVGTIDVGDPLLWSEDGMLTSLTALAINDAVSVNQSLVAYAVDSHKWSTDQAGSVVTTNIAIAVKWL